MPFTRPSFLGLSATSVKSRIGWNSQGSSLDVSLVRDPSNGDSFTATSSSIGAPVYFALGSFEFNGLLTKFTLDKDINGNPTYQVQVRDPRHLLDACKIITADYRLTTTGIYNLFNVFGYYENTGYGNSQLNDSGMPWQLVRNGVLAICNAAYGNYGGPITYRGQTYSLDLTDLPALPTYFRVGGRGHGMSILEFIQICCDAANYDFFVTLDTFQITLHTVARTNAYPLGTIGTMLSGTFAGAVMRSGDGLEERDEPTSVFLIGGDVHKLFEFDPTEILPFWGFDNDGTIMYGGSDTKHAVFLAQGQQIYSTPVKEYMLFVPEIASITGNVHWFTNDLELQILLGLGGHRDTFLSWTRYLWAADRTMYNLINLTSEAPTIQPPAAGPNVPNNIVNAQAQRITEIQAANRGTLFTSSQWRLRLVYESLFKYAKDYYGKKFAISVPGIIRKTDTDTGVISVSDEVSDGGWVDVLDSNTLMGLPAYASDLFQTQDGRYIAYAKYNSYNADLSRVNPTNSLSPSGTNTTFIKARVNNQVYFDSVENPFVVAEVDPIYDYPDSVVGMSGVIGPLYIATGIYIQASGGTITQQGQRVLEQLIGNQQGGSIPLVIHPAPRLPSGFEIPFKSNILTYGPWYAQGSTGRVIYEQDSSLVPWNYGGYTNLDLAGDAKSAQGVSAIQVIETGFVETHGYPAYNIGDIIEANGPNITNIAISFGQQGVSTTYSFETYVPRYGQLGKYNVDRFQKLNTANIKQIAEFKARSRLANLNATAQGEANTTLNMMNGMLAAVNIRSPNNTIAARGVMGPSGEVFPIVSTTTYPESLGLISPDASGYNATAIGTWDQIINPYAIFESGVYMPTQNMPTGTNLDSSVQNASTLSPWKNSTDGFTTKQYTKGINTYHDLNDYTYSGGNPGSSSVPKRVFGLRGPLVMAGWGYDTKCNRTPSNADYLTNYQNWKVGPLDPLWDEDRKVWSVHGTFKGITRQSITTNSSGSVELQKDSTSTANFTHVYNPYNETIASGTNVVAGYIPNSNKWYVVGISSIGGSGITSINGDTSSAQIFNVSTSGVDFSILDNGPNHTFQLPDAGVATRGVITSQPQLISGYKSFINTVRGGYGSSLGFKTNAQFGYCFDYEPGLPSGLNFVSTGSVGAWIAVDGNLGYMNSYVTYSGIPPYRQTGANLFLRSPIFSGLSPTAIRNTQLELIGLDGLSDYDEQPSYAVWNGVSTLEGIWGTTAAGDVVSGGIITGSGTPITASSLGLGNVENTALSTWAGSTNISTVGNIGTGTWNADTIMPTKGGTGLTSYSTGDIIYASGTNSLAKLPINSNGKILKISSGIPTWQDESSSLMTSVQTYYTTEANVNTAETELHDVQIPANSFVSNGYKAVGEWHGKTVAHVSDTRRIRVYFAGIKIYETAALVLNEDCTWTVRALVARTSTTEARSSVSFSLVGTSTIAMIDERVIIESDSILLGLDWTGTTIFRITGEAVNDADIIATLGFVDMKG